MIIMDSLEIIVPVTYLAQISGERLQDHWSSGLYFVVDMCDLVHDVEAIFSLP